MFDQLVFQPHHIPGAIHGTYKFSNDWEISVVSGPEGCGLYGRIEDDLYEVAIIRPNGNMTDDVSGWNTKEEVSAMMWVISQL
jgi:hypothetical protein